MSDLVIESIQGIEPIREGGYPMHFKVGQDGVTRIDRGSYSPEPFCESIFYQIYKGEKLHAVVNDRAVGEIYYS